MSRKTFIILLGMVILSGTMVLLIRPRHTSEAQSLEQEQSQASTRTGAWVDSITFSAVDQADTAISQLQADQLDIYAYALSDSIQFDTVKNDSKLAYTISYGITYELTFNPSGPEFIDGRLNPFSNPKIREAMNMLVDRNYIVQEISGDLAVPKFLPLNSAFADYARYMNTARSLEAKYAYNLVIASQNITNEMQAMGATVGLDGKWQYKNAPVILIFLIRVEDNRRQIGDYVANQLESIGFTVDRQYKTRQQASPIWNQSDPAEGQWYIYTGGWIDTGISRDDGGNFGSFYTPLGGASPLWQAYTPTPEFLDVATHLWFNDFASMEERGQLFTTALNLCMQDSVRVWLVDRTSFSARQADTTIASDLARGLSARAWPYTVRFNGSEGGNIRIAQPGILVEPWNPIGGSNWIYDQMPIDATRDDGVIFDPHDGLTWPQRIESAEVIVREGLPVTRTHEWVSLSFSPTITVPADAWVDWDAAEQRFITAGQKFTETLTANVKSIVYYPANLFETVKWHDGSPLDLSDFIMRMIMTFDPGKPESAIYDESQVPTLENFLSHFKGVRITSTDPLVIETYDDVYSLDAELIVQTWWPNYATGPAAWHNLTVGIMADAAKTLAFTTDKAGTLGIEWMNFINGPSLGILEGYLNENAVSNYIPYTNTLSAYITTEEAHNRWANLQTWYTVHSNFWLGTGPFYLAYVSPNLTLHLQRFADFPDPSDKWDFFVQNPSILYLPTIVR